MATRGRSLSLAPVIEADSFELMRQDMLYENVVSFQIPIGLMPPCDPRLVVRRIDPRDVKPGLLLIGQLRGRTLPVATAKFAGQVADALASGESMPDA